MIRQPEGILSEMLPAQAVVILDRHWNGPPVTVVVCRATIWMTFGNRDEAIVFPLIVAGKRSIGV